MLVLARHVLPIAGPPILDGAVLVDGERIAYVGPRVTTRTAETVDLGDAVLMPGLVNAHTHLELTAMRGLLEDLPFPDWIVALQQAKRTVFSPDRFLDAARLGIEEGLQAGVTTYADTCDSGTALEAMAEAGVRGVMYQEVFAPNPADASTALAELRHKVTEHQRRRSSLLRVGISPHAPYTVCDELFRGAADYALAEALPVAVHIAESDAECRLVREGNGPFADAHRRRGIPVLPRARSPIALLASVGILRLRPLLIHCVRLDAADVREVAMSGAGVAHCPISNAKFAHGVAPVGDLVQAGVPVGLGSDSMASNDRMHLLEEARHAILGQRIARGLDSLDAATALELATLGGARALGMAGDVGSLEVGKLADLAAFPVGPSGAPNTDPVAHAVFALGGTPASFVTVAGQVLVRDGRLVRRDPELPARMRTVGDELLAWKAARPAMPGRASGN